ncbi:hypothetical protein LTR99_011303, partial [Exophiala xenobiotica]
MKANRADDRITSKKAFKRLDVTYASEASQRGYATWKNGWNAWIRDSQDYGYDYT